ncbi:phosphoribosylaminoimidazolesuccinocarboxamide synthase [Salisaeta longa]|uniref:phosphoribosylaminoimidazolesuccinocarboxamide synthase n=1 Tax=Salisaeta longa TaxID=503170 RepID=UPI0003B69871|nr:phosphoribosylaminoimidazolesuccinocarboxamide synthase [Salisaeta longa]
MDTALIRQQLDRTIRSTRLDALGERYEGKVRDTYRRDDELVLVTTDRISAFDHVLRQTIPFKGQVLNQIAAHFFAATEDLVPNHVRSVPDPNVTVATACTPIPIEFVVRGYLAGHAWRVYRDGGRTLCGQSLPDGLQEASKLPEPVLTPATKAAEGHDEDISREAAIARGLIDAETFDQLESYALALFASGSAMAEAQGLLLVDTKYEFGRTPDGTLVVIDEVHTPDSSRYYYADTYDERLAADAPQRQLSKEFVREWLMNHGFQGKAGQTLPDLPDDFRVTVAERYIELYEALTGQAFTPDTHPDPEARIRAALTQQA